MTMKGINGHNIKFFSSPVFCLTWYKTYNIFILPQAKRSSECNTWLPHKIMGHQSGFKIKKAKPNIILGAQRTLFTSSSNSEAVKFLPHVSIMVRKHCCVFALPPIQYIPSWKW